MRLDRLKSADGVLEAAAGDTLEPDGLLIRIYSRLSRSCKLALLFGLVFSLMSHLYYFTGRFANEDDLHRIAPPIWNLQLGRWADGLKFSSAYPLPGVAFVFTIIFLALTVSLTVSILQIKKPLSIAVTALLLVSFPTLAYSFGYFYGVEQYVLALFFSALAVWTTKRWKWGFLAGAFCLAYSLGQYQSYLAYAMGLCAGSLLLLLLVRETTLKDFRLLLLRYIAMGISGIALYFGILNVCLRLTGTELGGYKGIDSMGQIPLNEMAFLLKKTYLHVLEFLQGNYFFGASGSTAAVYFICSGIFLILALWLLARSGRQLWRISFAAVLIFFFPLCINVVDFAAPETGASALNAYALVLLFVMPLALWELVEWEGKKTAARAAAWALSWALFLSAGAASWSFLIHTNMYYSKMSMYYEYTTSFYNRVLARVEELPGYTVDMPIAIISDATVEPYGDGTQLYPDFIIDDQGLWNRFIGLNHGIGSESMVTQKAIAIMKNSLGVSLTGTMMRQINEIKETKEYQEMGVWPESSSVKLINGTAVVNFEK